MQLKKSDFDDIIELAEYRHQYAYGSDALVISPFAIWHANTDGQLGAQLLHFSSGMFNVCEFLNHMHIETPQSKRVKIDIFAKIVHEIDLESDEIINIFSQKNKLFVAYFDHSGVYNTIEVPEYVD